MELSFGYLQSRLPNDVDMDDIDAAAAAILLKKVNYRLELMYLSAKLPKSIWDKWLRLPRDFARKFFMAISRILGEADLQRNTLQVKCSLIDPHPRLRPEMQCRAKFFEMSTEKNEVNSPFKIFINKNLLFDKITEKIQIKNFGDFEPRQHLRKKTHIYWRCHTWEHISVKRGLFAGDSVILNPPDFLENGDRVKIIKIK